MKNKSWTLGAAAVGLMVGSVGVNAAYVIEIDTDGTDDGVLTLNPNFSYGGDTTAASQSSASPAVGMTGGDSIFGGNGTVDLDTYTYSYSPGIDGDNLPLASGTALNDDGDFSGGVTAGGTGLYNVFATWPISNNVSGGDTTFRLSGGGGTAFSVSLDQNTVQGFVDPTNDQTFSGGEWIFLGTANLNAAFSYTLTQTPSSNSFVSMRAAGVLFDPIPEPATAALLGLGGLALLSRRSA